MGGNQKMTFIVKQREKMPVYGRICTENGGLAYTVQVFHYGQKVYENYFLDIKSAERALNRNVKNAIKKYM